MNFGLYRDNKIHSFLLCVALFVCTVAYGQEAEFIWAQEDQNSSRIVLSSLKNGVWQPAQKIVDDSNLNILPAMGMNSKHHKLVVWSAVSINGSMLKYSINNGGSWQRAEILSKQMSTNLAPVVVFDNNDICWVFWSANNGDDDDIYVSKFINGEWTTAEMVHQDNDAPDILPQAGQDENGNVWVTWQHLQSDGYVERSHSFEIQSRRRMAQISALKVETIKQMKQRSDLANTIKPPASFKARSRATLYFPNNKIRPSMPVDGNLY